ncbi:MAG: hypothetical protein L0Y56_19870 [Nitrospira sp.]|nr:hypothetical protein [Nitrospira sp.]
MENLDNSWFDAARIKSLDSPSMETLDGSLDESEGVRKLSALCYLYKQPSAATNYEELMSQYRALPFRLQTALDEQYDFLFEAPPEGFTTDEWELLRRANVIEHTLGVPCGHVHSPSNHRAKLRASGLNPGDVVKDDIMFALIENASPETILATRRIAAALMGMGSAIGIFEGVLKQEEDQLKGILNWVKEAEEKGAVLPDWGIAVNNIPPIRYWLDLYQEED